MNPYDEPEYNYSDLKLLNYNSERLFSSDIDEIIKSTNEVQVDWKKREMCLKKLACISLGNYGKNPKFIKIFNSRICQNLMIQMNDLRSNLMKTACRITCLICKVLSNLIESSILTLLTKYNLYKLVSSANNGNKTIFLIIKYIQSNKIINNVCELKDCKSNPIKIASAKQLMYIVFSYKNNMINKSRHLIEECMKIYMSDANGDVRSYARKIFLLYKKNILNMQKFFRIY